jgi:hypothetical protein
MNTNVFSIFPTLVTKTEGFLSASQCKSILDFAKKKTEMPSHGLILGENNISSHSSIINNPDDMFVYEISKKIKGCESVLENLRKSIGDYCNYSGIFVDHISNSWFNIQQEESLLKDHLHPNSVVSGAIYINVDNNSSPICFANPNQTLIFTIESSEKPTKYNSQFFEIQPKIGDLVMFPSWLMHGANHQKNNTKDRMVISFNAK